MDFRSNGILELRPMKPADMLRALQIISEYDEDDAYDARETYEESIEGQYVLTENGLVIGVVGATPIENTDRAYGLSWTYLQRADKRSGKGKQMLDWMIELLRDQGCRKVFVQASDYQDPNEGDIYFDARESYLRAGFMQELRQPDFYAPGDSMIVYGMRLTNKEFTQIPPNNEAIRITDVDEIPETNDAYWVAWELEDRGPGSQASDFDKLIREVKTWGARSLYMAFPSDVARAQDLMANARFRVAGRLIDYYEDGVDEVHYRYDLLS